MSVTLRFQSTGAVPGNARPVSMRGGSLTVGRSPDNDLVLPDPEKVISKRHCAIERQNGSFVVIDLSVNGTFLNYDKMPLGRTPRRLNDGDILTMGAYELVVEMSDDMPEEDFPPPVETPAPRRQAQEPDLGDVLDGAGGGDFLDDLLGDRPPSGPKSVHRPELGEDGLMPPLGEEEDPLAVREETERGPTHSDHGDAAQDYFSLGSKRDFIPDDWDDDLLGGGQEEETDWAAPRHQDAPSPPDGASPYIPPEEDPGPPDQEPTRPAGADKRSAPPAIGDETHGPGPRQPVPAQRTDAARAFLEALGPGHLDVPDDELEETMARMGGVMRTMIEGLREVLMTRAAIKSEFRIQATMVGASGNNPLKFSVSPEQAVEAMLRPRLPGYLEPAKAAQEALDDIKAHEVATMTGMEAALQGILRQLSPASLEGQIQSRGGLADMLKSRKSLYWETYERIYAQVSDQAEKEFHDLFGREFARAYQEQLEKLK